MTDKDTSPLLHCAAKLDAVTRTTGRYIAWCALLMVLLQCLVVALRYGFSFGSIALQETVAYLHASCFMLGAAYTLQCDQHVRVDIFYRRFSPRRQATVNLAGCLLFLLPFAGLILLGSLDYVQQAWHIRERSADAGGLPLVYALKTLIPLLGLTLLLQGLAEIARCLHTVRGELTTAETL